MKLIRCLQCNKVLGEVEGKARIKCKMAGCHTMNLIDTDTETQSIDQNDFAKIVQHTDELEQISGMSVLAIDEMRRKMAMTESSVLVNVNDIELAIPDGWEMEHCSGRLVRFKKNI